jgi:hypothetical protein
LTEGGGGMLRGLGIAGLAPRLIIPAAPGAATPGGVSRRAGSATRTVSFLGSDIWR